MLRGQQLGVLGGVHDDDVSAAQRDRVDPAQEQLLDDAGFTAVAPGVARADQVVESDRRPAEQHPREYDVEVTEVADEHRVDGTNPAATTY